MPAPTPFDLTTLAAARRWVGSSAASTDDELLQELIASSSRAILGQLDRGNLFPQALTEVQDGKDTTGITLGRWPVISVASLTVQGSTISPTSWPAASGGSQASGYFLSGYDGFPPGSPQRISLVGGLRFPKNPQNIAIAYTAGYQITAEAGTVTASDYKVQAAAPYGPWAADVAVTKADGTAMTKVASSPAAGQYSLDRQAPGTYQFAAADNGLGVLLTYGYVPADLARAATELVGERYRYKDRIGQTSRSIGGQETAAFDRNDLPKHIDMLLQPYKRVHIT